MYGQYDERTILAAKYISNTGRTVRETASHFGLSKSTVHKDMITRLPELDVELYDKVRSILDKNKAERHLRGGMATKIKYANKCVKTETKFSRFGS